MLPEPIANLAQSLRKLPGIGIKSSQKMAIDILQMKEDELSLLLQSVSDTRTKVKFCQKCGYFSENFLCNICSNDNRNHCQICIVEKPTDIIALEKSEVYRGVYHVLDKLISPLDNVFASNTTVDKLLTTIKEDIGNGKELELILFLKPGFAGQATTAYIKELLVNNNLMQNVKITRLAQGLPLYYNPDTLDNATMIRAIEDRREI
jgi:recombination protein RecR